MFHVNSFQLDPNRLIGDLLPKCKGQLCLKKKHVELCNVFIKRNCVFALPVVGVLNGWPSLGSHGTFEVKLHKIAILLG